MEIPEDKRETVLNAIYGGAPRKIEAIKLVREATGCGLAEAKEYVEKVGAELYAKDPQRFASSPKGKGCGAAAILVAVCALAGAEMLRRIFA